MTQKTDKSFKKKKKPPYRNLMIYQLESSPTDTAQTIQ